MLTSSEAVRVTKTADQVADHNTKTMSWKMQKYILAEDSLSLSLQVTSLTTHIVIRSITDKKKYWLEQL